ncbi:glycosyltransferase family 4 protein [Candidatus Saccharibacteria bacterium]|nr:glycosyltransferase family 4 protein [Candidatus Saccharibacteria bacterium]
MSALKTVILTEVRIYKNGDSIFADPSFTKILERYAQCFGEITLVTRILNEKPKNGFVNITDKCSSFANIGSIPKFLARRVANNLQEAIYKSDLVVLRMPSLVSIKVYPLIKRRKKTYLVEVMGCAWDAYWNHGFAGKIIALPAFLRIKRIIKKADYATYVTSHFLQERYPCRNKSISASNVSVSKIQEHKDYSKIDRNNITLFTAAALNVKYKGQKYVIKALRILKKKYGINATYYLAGKGNDDYLRRISKRYGVAERVVILGVQSREEIFDTMRKADIYVQPSLQEGLPRSMIEAMSCGCVCIGAKTAGIPELIREEYIFRRKSSKAIAGKINEVMKKDLCEISRQNANESKKYFEQTINARRYNYYGKIVKDIKMNKVR